MSRVFYLQKLKEGFTLRKEKNKAFSLRSYAKFLGIQAPSLSAILKEKRGLPSKEAEKIALKLKLKGLEKKQFIESSYFHGESPEVSLPLSAKQETLCNELHHKIIAEPEHYAIFSLLEMKGVRHDIYWMARRLGCSVETIDKAINNLLEAGFLKKENGKYHKQPIRFTTSEDVQAVALREAHKNTLKQAIDSIDSVDISARDFSSISFPANLARLPEAKKLIRDFRKQVAALFQDDSAENNEVYSLSVQLFPLTKLSIRGKE